MILKSNATAMMFAALCHTCRAWTVIHAPRAILEMPVTKPNRLSSESVYSSKASLTTMFAASSDNNAPKRKRKRKKKIQVVDDEDISMVEMDEKKSEAIDAESSTPPALNLKPREDAPVQLEVKNILTSSAEPEPSAISTISSMLSSMIGSTDTTRSGETTTQASSAINAGTNDMGFGDRPIDESLDQLLEDARLMTEEEKAAKTGVFSDEEGAGVKEMIGNALSTIVTADFFLVCAFLVWFLLGIFCSSVLKDDTVQIAFNNNFEKLVQPALGVLMIAAIGGNFFKEEEQEYDL